ncbi:MULTISPECIES: hypothetical protein [Brucella]|uniref:Uncharacterized protein n=1 Tax=Brucella haematophila TaxID=419474 RepID=A0ABX1DI62_9HYPH|nr:MULTISPECIES: hypothetical protein [Brucella]KAB2752335.1 hypothetical protein F9L05_04265 [Brucella anthropi]KAB2776504.1 hypothetical protein F9L00_14305 [Brucella anthropi]NKC02446.1 hypothetical protein [Brucella haematophila]TMV03089.1 hypothetical protein FGI60_11775 [Brucella haematophila]
MIMPGNSREVVVKALEGLTSAPHTLASKVINDLDDAGFRVVQYEELFGIVRDLLDMVDANASMHPSVIRAKALIEILAP